ncbi:cilia- and flagella-associated protein 99 [Denticeps clupeoides]|uniref:Cilia- and flagella-associated protein 99 n=1 Tax=Denticeps clupeoides TaxID=299321 RepID=A0AAY4ARR4_9TELE|nr:cilia- and flagella-associated protein 99 [Denticeps clupeoides]
MTKYGEIVREAARLLDAFRPAQQSVESFLETAAVRLQEKCNALHRKFVLDVVSGCAEHQKLLDVVVDAFYDHDDRCLLKADRSQFSVICYIAVFLLDDIGMERFSNIVRSLDVAKMHKFLSFFFNVTNLSTWILGSWSNIYDAAYVEANWIIPLLRWCPKIKALLDQLASGASNVGAAKKLPGKCTRPQEFTLTKPKPRPLPLPEPIPLQQKHHPVNPRIYKPPKEKQTLEEMKRKNRLKAQDDLYKANAQGFRCANPQPSERTKNVIAEITQARDSQLKFNAVFTSGMPATQRVNSLPIRLNTTAILKQGALYHRQMEEEISRIERLAEGAYEPSSFLQWQREMKEKDLQEELAKLERLRLEGKISHKEAMLAQARMAERNRQRAVFKKEETAELMREYAEKRLQEEKELRNLVQQVAGGHRNAKAARAQLQELKQRIVREVSQQNRQLLAKALEEAQAELSRKFELILQIRAIESVSPIRHKFVDVTETAGHRLLDEMSLAELWERLARLQEAQQQEQQGKRERILEERQRREELLLEHLDNITLHKEAVRQATARRQEEEAARPAGQQLVLKDERVAALQRRLEEKEQEIQRRKQKERDRDTRRLHSAKTDLPNSSLRKQTSEEQEWQEMERSVARLVQLRETKTNTRH